MASLWPWLFWHKLSSKVPKWSNFLRLRVTTPDGRWNATQVGGSPPQARAKLMLIEMEEARLGNPMFGE
jgi:hypothetical protein